MTLAGLIRLLVASWQMMVHILMSPSGLMVLAAVALAATLLAIVVRCARAAGAVTSGPLAACSAAQRAERRAAVVRRQFDPDAAGRARPRAPAPPPAAT